MKRVVQATINLSALEQNVQCVRAQAPNKKIWAMVKANAYGHGLLSVAGHLSSTQLVDGFGVACLAEAAQLRQENIKTPLLILAGVYSDEEWLKAFELSCDVVVHSVSQCESLLAFLSLPHSKNTQNKINIWLKLDSGMHRLGMSEYECLDVYNQLSESALLNVVGLMSHFACADEPEHELNSLQLQSFLEVKNKMGVPYYSLANSAAILAHPESHFDWLRPGIMLYGSSPFGVMDHQEEPVISLQPVMSLSSNVLAIKNVKAGDSVGYGASWVADKDYTLAVVAIGYGDGYPRHAKSGTPVSINGQKASLLGRVSMDLITVDVSHLSVAVGDAVELWGDQVSIDEVAHCSDTISYELMCRLTSRVQFVYR